MGDCGALRQVLLPAHALVQGPRAGSERPLEPGRWPDEYSVGEGDSGYTDGPSQDKLGVGDLGVGDASLALAYGGGLVVPP